MKSLVNKLYPEGQPVGEILDLTRAISDLPTDNRTAIQLYFRDNLPREKIAEQLGWSRSKVDQKITRGITLLKVKLNPGYFKEAEKIIKENAQRLLLR